jgi:hypothetical protein
VPGTGLGSLEVVFLKGCHGGRLGTDGRRGNTQAGGEGSQASLYVLAGAAWVGAGVASCSDGLGEQRLGSLVRAKSPWGGLMGRKEWMRRFAWPLDNTASERGRQCRCQKGGLSILTRSLGSSIGRRTTFRTRPPPPPLRSVVIMERAAFVCPDRSLRHGDAGQSEEGILVSASLSRRPSRCLCGRGLLSAALLSRSLGRASAVPGQERASGSCCVPEGLGRGRWKCWANTNRPARRGEKAPLCWACTWHDASSTPTRKGCRCAECSAGRKQALPARLAAARATRAPQRATSGSEVCRCTQRADTVHPSRRNRFPQRSGDGDGSPIWRGLGLAPAAGLPSPRAPSARTPANASGSITVQLAGLGTPRRCTSGKGSSHRSQALANLSARRGLPFLRAPLPLAERAPHQIGLRGCATYARPGLRIRYHRTWPTALLFASVLLSPNSTHPESQARQDAPKMRPPVRQPIPMCRPRGRDEGVRLAANGAPVNAMRAAWSSRRY